MSNDAILDAILADFAEHLVPEAFATPTRAYRVTLEPDEVRDAARPEGPTVFAQWVDDRIRDALDAAWPHDRPRAVAYTSDGPLLRRYDEHGCGHLDCVVAQVSREVGGIPTPWVFAADLPRPLPRRQMIHDDDARRKEVRVDPTGTRWLATWYAEARGRGVAATAAGGLFMDGEQMVSSLPLEVRSTWVTRRFHRMLYRHPARRRHPLRRRR